MKKALVLILVLFLYNYNYSQDFIYVSVENDNLKPNLQNDIRTNNEVLNEIFKDFKVKNYYQSFQNAKSKELLSFYEIHLDGNVDLLEKTLKEYGFFSKIYTCDYYVEACDSLVYINDTYIVNNLVNNNALNMLNAECAWAITKGSSDIVVALVEWAYDSSHEDLVERFESIIGEQMGYSDHGTFTSSCISTTTNNNKGIAGIGYNTRIRGYRLQNNIWNSVWDAYQSGIKIINISWSGIGSYPTVLAVEEMTRNGTLLIVSAGNTPTANYHRNYADIPGVISVSGVNSDNMHAPTNRAHNESVDVCALSENVTLCKPGNNYGGGWGTSFSAPQVAGVAALILSINPCLSPAEIENIIKYTTDPITDANNFLGLVGTGRVNAYKAVKAAKAIQTSKLDLYIKDRPEDFGNEIHPYHWQATRDDSFDIWARNQPDGRENQIHQEPEYDGNNPIYIYVKVRNKSCISPQGNEMLKLYWTKAASWTSWPQNWNGTQPDVGDNIGGFNIGMIQPGKDSIYEFIWDLNNSNILQNWAVCLLARIEGSDTDEIVIHPGRIDDDVYFNNNISLKNITIIDASYKKYPEIWQNDVMHCALGNYMYIGNPVENPNIFDVIFVERQHKYDRKLINEAEIRIIFDDKGWELIKNQIIKNDDIKIIRDKEIILLKDSVILKDIVFPPNTRIPIYVGFNFLVQKSFKNRFKYDIKQYLSKDNSNLGGVYFEIENSNNRPVFKANAYGNKTVFIGDSVLIKAEKLSEQVIYNWYNKDNKLIYSGTDLLLFPNDSETYILEVIAIQDGFKDYDEFTIEVKYNKIDEIFPNPSSDAINVKYSISKALSSSFITIMDQNGAIIDNYFINPKEQDINIKLINYKKGTYNVILICDENIEDSKTLVIQ